MTGLSHQFIPGDRVAIGDGTIKAVIEELIFARNMAAPVYLVEWWHEGQRQSLRVHQDEITGSEGNA